MTRLLARLLDWACDPVTAEAVAGDLEERYGERFHWRRLGDVLSVCVLHSRVRRPTRREILSLATAGMLLALTGPQPVAPSHYRIDAVDPAGRFTLEVHDRRVIAATLDGVGVPAADVVQAGDTLVLKGGDRGRDFVIALRPGGISWAARVATP